MHYLNVTNLRKELTLFQNSYGSLSKMVLDKHDNYTSSLQLIKVLGSSILDKLNYLAPLPPRPRRGIANFLGRAISFVTGNMDDIDQERLEKITRNLDKNEINLENQVKNGYSLTTAIINKNQETFKRVEQNEKILTEKIGYLQRIQNQTFSEIHDHHFTETLSYLSSYGLTLLTLIQEIENSLLFCNNNQLHPSVISANDLRQEIKSIYSYYHESIPLDLTTLPPYLMEELLKVSCEIKLGKIYYYISVPVNFETNFTLYKLLSLPSYVRSEYYLSVIPERRFILEDPSTSTYLSPTVSCVKLPTRFQCEEASPMHQDSCSVRAVKRTQSLICPKVFVNLNDSFVQSIPETSQYVFYFPRTETVEFNCPSYSERKVMIGIYLYYNRNCVVSFRNQTLPTSFNTTAEMLISDFALSMENSSYSLLPFNVSLSHLQMELSPEYYSSAPTPIQSVKFENIHHLYVLYGICIILFVLFLVVLITFSCKRARKARQTPVLATGEFISSPLPVEPEPEAPGPSIPLLRFPISIPPVK